MVCWLVGTQEEAAEAYDIAAIKFRGANVVTNFDMSRYDIAKIFTSNNIHNLNTNTTDDPLISHRNYYPNHNLNCYSYNSTKTLIRLPSNTLHYYKHSNNTNTLQDYDRHENLRSGANNNHSFPLYS